MRRLLALALVIACSTVFARQQNDDKVILVLLDGIRWQDVFRGADPELLNKEAGGVADVDALKKEFWREAQDERRETLMPFLWNTLAKQGQIYGNRDAGSAMRVNNKFHFSYPGYSEMIVGFADDRINTNDPILNPNPSVFEFLNNHPAFKGKVAVFSVWSVVRAMMNPGRSGLPVNAALEPMDFGTRTPAFDAINGLKRNLHHPWPKDPYDALCFYTAMEYLRVDEPRAMWITFGETDTFAHEGRYDNYLNAVRRTDRMLEELWTTLQSMPEYKGKTTLIVSVDHGRGLAPSGWKSHGASIPGADETWLAVIGPHTPALGVRTNIPEVTTSQIAATVARAVGQDYNARHPLVALPIADAIKR
ncbi:MAG: alkaline phosphatase family protein [Fimbriimonadaceae bacterium]